MVISWHKGQVQAGPNPCLPGGTLGLHNPLCRCYSVKHFPSHEQMKSPLECFVALQREYFMESLGLLLCFRAQALSSREKGGTLP